MTPADVEARIARELLGGVPVGEVVRRLFDAGLRVVDVLPPFFRATGVGLSASRSVIDAVKVGAPLSEQFPGQFATAVEVTRTLPEGLVRGLVVEAIVRAAPFVTLVASGDSQVRVLSGAAPDSGSLVTHLESFDALAGRLAEELRLVGRVPFVRPLAWTGSRILLGIPCIP